ncbi:aminotransferase class IV [Inquilinus limosus]|uniref:aminotransferase class IV n=1 Tax=Inquilinus limosus TaxID=171674 RepID=UPI003F14FB3B
MHHGLGVFEGVRVYDGVAFALAAHMERLVLSAERIGIAVPYEREELVSAARQVVSRSGFGEAYLRPLIWIDGSQLGIYPPDRARVPYDRVDVAIVAWPWPPLFGEEIRRRGVALTTKVPYIRPSKSIYPVAIKVIGGHPAVTVDRMMAIKQGFDDALVLDEKGALAQASGSNLFALIDGVLTTPPPDSVLNGITRQTVIGLARSIGLQVSERQLLMDDLDRTQELFLTGTAYEVLPVSRIDDRRFAVGLVTQQLQRDYSSLVRGLLRRQAADGTDIVVDECAYVL